jgi:hypothetical protein
MISQKNNPAWYKKKTAALGEAAIVFCGRKPVHLFHTSLRAFLMRNFQVN